jgi:LuxR family maltose regulon positive regulatory protein
MALLQAARGSRLTLVCAPAGYGKTTLLSEWLQGSAMSWAWLSLDRSDSDLHTFATCLIKAICTSEPGACRSAQAALWVSQSPSPEQLAGLFINDFTQLPHDITIVLDDYQLVSDRRVHELLTILVRNLPEKVHLALATRSDPPLPISQWRARGFIAEVRAAELRFSFAEVGEMLSREIGVELPEHTISQIAARTDGWITGLKLATLSIRDRAVSGGVIDYEMIADKFSDGKCPQITDFLLGDVLSRQPRAVQEFLMRISILERFCAPLCDVLGSDVDGMPSIAQSGFVLRWIERANLFLIPLDESRHWYRFHPFFRHLLGQRLNLKHSQADIAVLHQRASDWLGRQGLTEEAVQHALAANDFGSAAALIEARRHELLDQEDWHTLNRWLNLLPNDIIEQRPALLLACAAIAQIQCRYTQMPPLLTRAAALLSTPGDEDTMGDSDPARVALIVELRSLQCAVELLVNNDPHSAEGLADRQWERVPASYAYVRDRAVFMWAVTRQMAGRFAEARAALMDVINGCDEQRVNSIARALASLAFIHASEGLWSDCARWAEQCLTLATRLHLSISAGWARYWLGVCAYESNDLQAAVAHFSSNAESISLISACSAHDSLMGLALAYQILGERTKADETVAALDNFDLHHAFAPRLAEVQSLHARLSLLRGDTNAAVRWLHTTNLEHEPESFARHVLFHEAPQITSLRTDIAIGSPASLHRAEVQLDALLATAHALHAVRREIEVLTLQALVMSARGKVPAALDALKSALALAQARGFVRTIADVGPGLMPLLMQLAQHNAHADYARLLLRLCTSSMPRQPAQRVMLKGEVEFIEPLTNREMQILQLLGKHMSNEEIAQALFISPLTVKSHTRKLYEKLGVKRRRFAVQRAQELCLLPAA